MSDFNKVTRVNINRLGISDINLDNKKTNLTWSVRNGYPRIVVFYGDNPEARGIENMTILPFTSTAILGLFGFIREVAKDRNGDKKYSVSCYNNKFVDGRRTDVKEVVGTVEVMRDELGVVCLKIKTDKKPDVRFRLLMDKEWYKIYDKTGTEITSGKELSSIYAESYADTLSNVMSDLITDYTLKNNVQFTER